MDQRIYIDCDCETETVCLEPWPEDEQICMAFFSMGHSGTRRSWGERLKLAWQVIKTGEPYADMVILSYEKAQKLAKYISKYTEEK